MLLFALSFVNYKLLVGEGGCTVHHVVIAHGFFESLDCVRTLNQEVS